MTRTGSNGDCEVFVRTNERIHKESIANCAVVEITNDMTSKDSLEDCFLPLVSNSTPCNHQKELEVSNNCQISYCQNCKPKTGTKTIWVENLKPAYRAYLASKEIKTWSPVHNPKCKSVTGGNVFNFKTPVEGRTYFLNGKPEIRIEVQMNTNSE